MPNSRPEEADWYKEFQRANTSPSGVSPSRPSRPEDRRKHARFDVGETQIQLYREGLLSALRIVKRNKGRAAIDLSEGGAKLLASERIPPGTRVRIRIEMGKFQDAVEAVGVVRWCYQSAKKPGEFFAGAMFVDLSPAQLKKIALMREWFNSPQYRAMRESRHRQKDLGIIFPK
jgi:hypothetical protein